MAQAKPEFREDDSWFSKAQLAAVAPADAVDALHSPVPTQMVSNGEYMPHPQTEQQKQVEARLAELTGTAAERLGMSRRRFLATSGGTAAAFLAMNDVFGRFFRVRTADMYESAAFAQTAPPSDLFVFDTQLHTVRSSLSLDNLSLRAIAQGSHSMLNASDLADELGGVNTPWNPALVGLPNVSENFYLVQFIRDVYLDSQVAVGLMSNNTSAAIPDVAGNRPPKDIRESEIGEFLTAPQTAAVRDWLNMLSGSTRLLAHGQLFPGLPGSYPPDAPAPTNLEYMQWQIDELKPDSWKGYTSANSAKYDLDPESLMRRWRLDDQTVAYPMYDLITRNVDMLKTRPGFFNICIHKGLSTDAPDDPALGFPVDIPQAARDWPVLNFIIYHSCIRPGFWMLAAMNDVGSGRLRQGVPDILWTTQFAIDCAGLPNVYAELGTIFASCVITFPAVCAHIIGQLLKFMGEDRIVFGSDSVWYGSPQWQIEAFWRFQIPEALQKQYGYPPLTETAKRKILGLNSARLYQIPAASVASGQGPYTKVPSDYATQLTDELKTVMEFPGYTSDTVARMREVYRDAGQLPSHTRYGWVRL